MTASTGPAASLHVHTEVDVKEIARVAQTLRLDVLKMVYGAQSGHLGGAFSAAEIVASLYWHHLRIDPQVPAWGERDRFLLSKGHASALLYAALARRGFFPVDELGQFRHLNSRLNGHPDRDVPGVEVVAGPLGHGVAVGAGLALGLRMGVGKPSAITAPSGHASHGRVYVLLGDGELNAGIVWEGVMTAAKYRLGNLVAIVGSMAFSRRGPRGRHAPPAAPRQVASLALARPRSGRHKWEPCYRFSIRPPTTTPGLHDARQNHREQA